MRGYYLREIRRARAELSGVLKEEDDILKNYNANKCSVKGKLGEIQLKNETQKGLKKARFRKKRLVREIEILAGKLDRLKDGDRKDKG